MTTIAKGTPIRFKRGPLSISDAPEGKFLDDVVAKAGDEGRYLRPSDQPKGWHILTFEVTGGTFYVHVHPAQFEVIEGADR